MNNIPNEAKNTKITDKIDELIKDIQDDHCLMCGTQSLYCGCSYDDAINKLKEVKEIIIKKNSKDTSKP